MTGAEPPHTSLRRRWRGRGLCAAALLVALVVGSRGITDEERIFTNGDMPRYLMDGVFLYDFLGSAERWTFEGSISYAQRYFVQYPALSIGHHPPLLPISLVPFFAIFGVSVFAARLAVLVFLVLSVVLLYRLVECLYDEEVAGWACLLFASSGMIGIYSQRVLSETPTIALILGALNALVRFCHFGRFRDYLRFIVFALASLASRQLAIFMWPAYVAIFIAQGGWSRLGRRDVLIATVAALVVVIPVAVATVLLSPFNVAVVLDLFRHGPSVLSRLELFYTVFHAHLLPSLGLVTVAGLLMARVRRDGRIMVAVYWMVAVLGGVLLVTGAIEPARYSIIAVPAYCVCAASLVRTIRARELRGVAIGALAFAVAWQLWAARDRRPSKNGSYEEAARFVVNEPGGQSAPTVLYSSSIDTGFFVFFVRKHDPDRRLVVLRSDKLLTTSLMSQLSVEDRIHSPQEIYPLLDRFGTRFIVIEDQPTGSMVLDWLRDELKGHRFIERRRIPVDPSDPSVQAPSLVVYEYTGARPPDPDAEIHLKLPLVGREVRVRLSDLHPDASH